MVIVVVIMMNMMNLMMMMMMMMMMKMMMMMYTGINEDVSSLHLFLFLPESKYKSIRC